MAVQLTQFWPWESDSANPFTQWFPLSMLIFSHILSNFVSPPWKLHNRYCHNVQGAILSWAGAFDLGKHNSSLPRQFDFLSSRIQNNLPCSFIVFVYFSFVQSILHILSKQPKKFCNWFFIKQSVIVLDSIAVFIIYLST